MAWVFVGIVLIIEGFAKLGAVMPYKDVLQGVCLIIAGLMFALRYF